MNQKHYRGHIFEKVLTKEEQTWLDEKYESAKSSPSDEEIKRRFIQMFGEEIWELLETIKKTK